jgi:hypothetical protein
MLNLLFHLALFAKTKLPSIWIKIVADIILKKTSEAYIEKKIKKHEDFNDRLKHLLELKRSGKL